MDASSVIKITSLKPWDVPRFEERNQDTNDENVSTSQSVKFSVSPTLNQKIYLCQGGVANLDLDCIVLPINEMILRRSTIANEVHVAAGLSLTDFYKTLKGVKTGNVALGSGHDLPARYIMHAMEPGINSKYPSAVQNALHRCYRNAMQTAAENNLNTVAFTPLNEYTNTTVDEDMAHIALCTIRCCLQKLSNFKAVVFSVPQTHLELYLKLLPAYFPRNDREAAECGNLIPSHSVGEWGEIVVAERAIRITDLPISQTPSINESATESASTSDCESNSDMTSDLVSGKVTKHSFSSMSGDHDTKRMKQITSMTNEKMRTAQERIYRRLLRLARTDDLSKIASTKALYLCGDDRNGSPVAVLVAKYINVPQLDMDKALLYFIHILDSIVNEKYSLVYFHTMSQSHNHPPMNFVKRVYNVLDRRYRDNLKHLYIVHPTFWSRVFTWFFTTFTASDVKGQVTSVKNIPELYQFIAPDQIDIPPFVLDHDLKVNIQVYQNQRHPSFPVVQSLDKPYQRVSL